MRDDEYEVRFSAPIYVTQISVLLGEFDDVRGMRLTGSDHFSGKAIKTTIDVTKTTGEVVVFKMNTTLTSFTIQRGAYSLKN